METIQIEQGDRVVLYTDGIVECRSPGGELFGLERFHDYIIGHFDPPPGQMIDGLFHSIEELRSGGVSFEDDNTIIVTDIV
jgi:serine phosphatase RsbU (regulator of sigma subunit)